MTHPNPEGIPQSSEVPLKQPHEACEYFTDTYGHIDPDADSEALDLIKAPELHELASEVALSAITTLAWSTGKREKLSVQTIRDGVLKCGECVLKAVCPIESELSMAIKYEEAMQLLAMISEGPDWLLRARTTLIDKTPRELDESIQGAIQQEDVLTAICSAGIDMGQLRGGIHNQRIADLVPDELPVELSKNLTSIRQADEFETHLIEFDGATHSFAITDLTGNNGYKGVKPTEQAYGILLDKLLGILRETDVAGQPLILSGGLQKIVRRFEGGFVSEIRMGTKDRLYNAVSVAVIDERGPTGKPVYRVLILGVHGDNEQSQEVFYKQTGLAMLPRSR